MEGQGQATHSPVGEGQLPGSLTLSSLGFSSQQRRPGQLSQRQASALAILENECGVVWDLFCSSPSLHFM